ncbi:hypothetical protein Goklo_024945 [Gossypium klotzschianum]|uniref:Uncharacterized protein n=2 Tax=Gossypium TaxID=3633 RepID=A0A7J8W5U0_9ROSI|nr:hypothetical protein [Gossypium klotzschianum]
MPQIKDLGHQYFQDLVSRSFFQISSKDEFRFVMHDLINDLAQVVAGEIFSKLESDRQQKFSNCTRHSSYTVSKYDTMKKFEAFNQVKSLRTFLPLRLSRYQRAFLTNIVLVDLLPRLGYLRVLSLFGMFQTSKVTFKDGKSCNLHYLDIRGVKSIERMPFGIDKLTNLRRLSDFIIGEGDGHRMRELKYLSNLKGDIRLSGLENINGQDAREARLYEKEMIDRLVLHWSKKFEKDSGNTEDEEWVLDSLCPPKKLEQLVIENYGGAKFSTWIADSSFKNMLSLELRNYLSIGGLDEVHKIGAELFGANQSNAFASLETLHFESMPNWEEWDSCEGDEQASKFPSLLELSIRECPQLLGRLPTFLQSLQKLEIYECRRLVVSISSFLSLCELCIEGCEQLVYEGSSSPEEVTSLKNVSLKNISKFDISAEKAMLRFANSEVFDISGWKELESLSQNGLSLVGHHFITIEDCPQLVSLEREEERLPVDKIPGVESLEIWYCERLNRLPEVLHAFTFLTGMKLNGCPGLVCLEMRNFPPALKKLEISKCENLQYLVDENVNDKSMSSNTCLLEHLEIMDCPSLIWLSSRGDICNRLQHLEIGSCSKLSILFLNAKLPAMLQQLVIWDCPVHLEEIEVHGCPSLVSFEESALPTTNLRVFSIHHCVNFSALPKCINNFSSLRELKVVYCSDDISFQEEGFPTSLTSLEISNAPRIYTSLVEWGFNRLTFLQELKISGEGCSNVVSFPEERIGRMLPPPLTYISIHKFENLEYMCSKGFQHLTSLQKLFIVNCPKLTSLPEKDMLLSLECLYISNCPLLEEGCSRGKGREWSKIAHIPFVQIEADLDQRIGVKKASTVMLSNVYDME